MDIPHIRTSGAYPAAVGLGFLSMLTIVLDLPPLVWHGKNRNAAAVILICWIILFNLLSFINAVIWPNDNILPPSFYDGVGLCDVEVKLMVGRSTALPAATFCILKGLADVMDTKRITLAPAVGREWKPLLFNLGFGIGIPTISMILHYIVQISRYDIVGISGCEPVFFQSNVTIILIIIPPLLITLADVYLCILITYRLRIYRTRFTSLLRSSNTTKTRFLRLLILSLVFIFALFPITLYILFLNWPRTPEPYSWNRVHSSASWDTLVFVPSSGKVLPDRWVGVACGFVVFAAFGLGKDAKATYRNWVLAIGMGRVLPILKNDASARRASESSAWMSSFGSKIRLVPNRVHRKNGTVTEVSAAGYAGRKGSDIEDGAAAASPVDDTWQKRGSEPSVTRLVVDQKPVKGDQQARSAGSKYLQWLSSPAFPVHWMTFKLPMRSAATERELPLTQMDATAGH